MIQTYRNVLDDPDYIIQASESLFKNKVEHPIRVCEGTVIYEPMIDDERILAIPGIIQKYADEYLKNKGIEDYEMEFVQIIHYNKGEGFFGKHEDGNSNFISC